MNTVTVTFEGKEERAVELEFEPQKEGWSSYVLPEGTMIKLKHVVTRVFKLIDRAKDDGSPLYVLEGQVIVTTVPSVSVDSMQEENASASL